MVVCRNLSDGFMNEIPRKRPEKGSWWLIEVHNKSVGL